MTLKLLENELIKKYFTGDPYVLDEKCTAEKVLQAMCEPIKKGESWLELYGDGKVELNEGYDDDGFDSLHPYFLRLPDQFQPPKKAETYGISFWSHGVHHEVDIDLECLAKALVLARKP